MSGNGMHDTIVRGSSMDSKTDYEQLVEWLGVAAPEQFNDFKIVDNSDNKALYMLYLKTNVTRWVPAVRRNAKEDTSIPNARMALALGDAVEAAGGLYYDTLKSGQLYPEDWKGGYGIYRCVPKAYAFPSAKIDSIAEANRLAWIMPYSKETDEYAVELIGKLFVYRLGIANIGDKGQPVADFTEFYVEINEGVELPVFTDSEAVLKNGHYRFTRALKKGESVYEWEDCTQEDYQSAKRVAADMLSYVDNADPVEMDELAKLNRYLDLVARGDKVEMEIVDGEAFKSHPLIHVSFDNIPRFTPFVSARTLGGDSEDRQIPRVCVTPYVYNSIVAKGDTYSRYRTTGKDGWPVLHIYGLRPPYAIKPSGKLVKDAPATAEYWLIRYSETTQHYEPSSEGEAFLGSVTQIPMKNNTEVSINRAEWYVMVKPDCQILWCKGQALKSGYHHLVEERSWVDGKPHVKFLLGSLSADQYLERKALFMDINKSVTDAPKSSSW